ncbi:MAG: class I SAM-dependent methyltransferase [Rhodanobacter sp.]|nr:MULTISPECIES: class I SAM-dependent methyltransferase [Rhodanobacter]TAN19132.1 MAG: class I SAM-dependent methyltransferase [Rhodanobacter sp.]UJJ56526.1 class I SAM-dependent methyltransferase [Rhodanobacter thiooxydans]
MDRTARELIARRYDGWLQRNHVRWKLRVDPAYAATAAIITRTPLPLLDIGCGLGLLGQYLNAGRNAQSYVGLDHDHRKILAGQRAAHRGGLDVVVELQHADANELPAVHGHVALLDVLHYLDARRQRSLLKAATEHLTADGCLVIRSVLREPNWRFHATRVEEFFLRTSGWIPGGAQHYPTAAELRGPLEDAGLEVGIRPLRGRTPYNSYLIVACAPPRAIALRGDRPAKSV